MRDIRGEFVLDFVRQERIGLEEAIYAAGKSVLQIEAIMDAAAQRGSSLLITRLDNEKYAAFAPSYKERLDFCETSKTAIFGQARPIFEVRHVAIVCAGTSDVAVAREAERTLAYHGEGSAFIADVGVAGLWRFTQRLDEIRTYPVLIVVAGMDAALASVTGGLFPGPIIAVPTSIGYGAAEGGRTALNAMLASCAPGLSVVNIDNGYGAACAALRLLNTARRLSQQLQRH
jgi:NCAIR mutase (PurE)-related protein